MNRHELSNQLKNQNLGNVSPASFLQVGASVFPDQPTVEPLSALSSIINAYQAIHLPSYGNPIAQTGGVVSVDGNENIIVPTKAQIYQVQYITFENTGGSAPVVATLKLGGVPIGTSVSADYITSVTIPPATSFGIPMNIFADVNLPLSVLVTSGTAGELTTKAIYILTSQ